MGRHDFTIKEHMASIGLNPKKKSDKLKYAHFLEKCHFYEPRQLRGTKKDPETGYYWSRKEEYIAKNKFGINISLVASLLKNLNPEIGYCVLTYTQNRLNFSCYLVSLSNPIQTVYVSVFTSDKGVRRILQVIPVKSVIK